MAASIYKSYSLKQDNKKDLNNDTLEVFFLLSLVSLACRSNYQSCQSFIINHPAIYTIYWLAKID